MSESQAPVPQAAQAVPTPAEAAKLPANSQEQNNQSPPEAEAQAIAADPTLTNAQKKQMINKLKIKYNGREYDEELPFEIPDNDAARDYMSKNLQMAKLGQAKSQQYSQLEKEVISFIEQLRANPKAALRDPRVGVDVKKLVQEIIEEEIENSKKSPEQLRAEELERELSMMRSEREREKKDFETREYTRLKEEAIDKYDNMISSALDKSKLPQTAQTVSIMASYLERAVTKGLDLSADDLVELVRSELNENTTEFVNNMSDEDFEKQFKSRINTLRKKSIAKSRQNASQLKPKIADVGNQNKPKAPSSGKQEKVSMKKFFGF